MAIKTDGTLWTWGSGTYGRLGTGTTTNRCSPGTTAGGGTNWCQISSGYRSTAALKTDGTLWTWGCNGSGQLGDNTTNNRSSPGTLIGGGTTWCQVSNGTAHMTAIKTDGTLWTWGCNGNGQLGDGTTTNRCSPITTAGGGLDWCQSSVGYFNIAAIKTDGALWTWGFNSCGQLGDGTTIARCSPGTTAGGGTTWCQSSVGYTSMGAVKTDGTLWTWGSNSRRVLGECSGANRCSPGTTTGGGTTWCYLSFGRDFGNGVKTNGTLWSWGYNNRGQLASSTNGYSPITTFGYGTSWCLSSAGRNSALAINSIT
jgi:alpha-tubulin suppressor-like RCC1 family protein